MRKILIILIIVISGCAVLWLLRMTTSRTAGQAKNLLIDLSAFPEGWSEESRFSAYNDHYVLQDQNASDWAGVSFAPISTEDNRLYQDADQMVWDFGLSLGAAWEFYHRFQGLPTALTPIELPKEAYTSKVADRFQLICGVVPSGPEFEIKDGWIVCSAVGQYGRFISTFSAPVGNEYDLTFDDLWNILKTIDDRMACQVKNRCPESTDR